MLVIFLTGVLSAGCKRESAIERFVKNHHASNEFHLYPSTMRMANLKDDPDYNDMVKDIRHATIYNYGSLPSSHVIDSLYSNIIADDYEDIMTMSGNAMNMRVFLKEKKKPEWILISEADSAFVILDVRGMINILKLPNMLSNFNENNLINVFNLKDTKNHQN